MKQTLPKETDRQQNFHARHLHNNRPAVSQAFVDNRKSKVNQMQMMAAMENAPRAIAQRRFIEQIHSSPRMSAQRQHRAAISHDPVRRMTYEAQIVQGIFKPTQFAAAPAEKRPTVPLHSRWPGPDQENQYGRPDLGPTRSGSFRPHHHIRLSPDRTQCFGTPPPSLNDGEKYRFPEKASRTSHFIPLMA